MINDPLQVGGGQVTDEVRGGGVSWHGVSVAAGGRASMGHALSQEGHTLPQEVEGTHALSERCTAAF